MLENIYPKEKLEKLEPFLDKMTLKQYKDYVISKGFYDIERFSDYFLSEFKRDKKTLEAIKTPPFHSEIWDSMNLKDTLTIIARDHAKTTSEIFYIIWNICYQVDPAILLLMSDGLGKETMAKIRDQFETNLTLRHIFGRLVPNRTKAEMNKSWSGHLLKFLNGSTLEIIAMGGSLRGKRPTLIMVDDPQEDKDVLNPQITDKFNSWFFTSVYGTLDPSGRCMVFGTIIGNLCFVNYLKNADKDFNIIEYKAIKNIKVNRLQKDKMYRLHGKLFVGDGKNHIVGGVPLWPEKWSLESLDKRYQKLQDKDDAEKFMQEYQNEPLILNGKPFYSKPLLRATEVVNPIRVDDIFEDLLIFGEPEQNCLIGGDVAEGLLSGDFSTLRVRSRKTLKLLASYRGHIDADLLPTVIDRLYDLGFTGRIGIEKNNHGLTALTACMDYDWYGHLYKERPLDKITKKPRDSYGFNTNKKTRPVMLDNHKSHHRDGFIDLDEQTKGEMLTFYRKENGKPEALNGCHDDLIIGDAICLQMVPYPIFRKIIV